MRSRCAAPDAAHPLSIALKYDRRSLALGETLLVTARVRNASGELLPMVMVDLPIPPGFGVDTASLEALRAAGRIDKYQLTSRQVLVYLRSLEGELQLSYRLRATMPVKATATPAEVYEYYRPESRAASMGEVLEVVR